MAWFGFGKKEKLKKNVLADMEHLFKSYGLEVIGSDSDLLKRLNKESKESGYKSDNSFIDILLNIFVYAIDENLDFMVEKNLSPRHGSLFCISNYIHNAYLQDTLELDGESRCISTALSAMWSICHHHLIQQYEDYKDVVIGKEINPFKNQKFKTFKE
jgi:hypothetical protein|tara:strand:+ start:311 stop:784 length:474 start_codon:yes stop_codon:yes gene_type:complete